MRLLFFLLMSVTTIQAAHSGRLFGVPVEMGGEGIGFGGESMMMSGSQFASEFGTSNNFVLAVKNFFTNVVRLYVYEDVGGNGCDCGTFWKGFLQPGESSVVIPFHPAEIAIYNHPVAFGNVVGVTGDEFKGELEIGHDPAVASFNLIYDSAYLPVEYFNKGWKWTLPFMAFILGVKLVRRFLAPGSSEL